MGKARIPELEAKLAELQEQKMIFELENIRLRTRLDIIHELIEIEIKEREKK